MKFTTPASMLLTLLALTLSSAIPNPSTLLPSSSSLTTIDPKTLEFERRQFGIPTLPISKQVRAAPILDAETEDEAEAFRPPPGLRIPGVFKRSFNAFAPADAEDFRPPPGLRVPGVFRRSFNAFAPADAEDFRPPPGLRVPGVFKRSIAGSSEVIRSEDLEAEFQRRQTRVSGNNNCDSASGETVCSASSSLAVPGIFKLPSLLIKTILSLSVAKQVVAVPVALTPSAIIELEHRQITGAGPSNNLTLRECLLLFNRAVVPVGEMPAPLETQGLVAETARRQDGFPGPYLSLRQCMLLWNHPDGAATSRSEHFTEEELKSEFIRRQIGISGNNDCGSSPFEPVCSGAVGLGGLLGRKALAGALAHGLVLSLY